jgi:predicted flap endonuclease-1-like 5' DNA nuclease
MRQPVFFLSVLLVLWITGASYWYLCKTRYDCKEAVAPTVAVPDTTDTLAPTPAPLLLSSVEKALKVKETNVTDELPLAAAMPVFSPENIKTDDDLKVVNGIGPKIAQLLNNREITAWKALSETSPSYLTAILHEDGGERFRIHNPASWPHQALLLHEGRWDEFRELREKLWTESR